MTPLGILLGVIGFLLDETGQARAALDNRLLEYAFIQRGFDLGLTAGRACTLANQRHIVHITAKALDVVPHPGNGRLLVIVAIVTALSVLILKLLHGNEAENVHPVIHGNGYDSVLGQE